MLRPVFIVIFMLISLIGFYLYLSNSLPPGIVPKGETSATALISLWTGIIGLIGTTLTTIMTILQFIAKKRKKEL